MACPKCGSVDGQDSYIHAEAGGITHNAFYCTKCSHRYLEEEAKPKPEPDELPTLPKGLDAGEASENYHYGDPPFSEGDTSTTMTWVKSKKKE